MTATNDGESACTCGPPNWWEQKDERTHYAGCPLAEPWQFKREYQHEHAVHAPGTSVYDHAEHVDRTGHDHPPGPCHVPETEGYKPWA